MELDLADLIVVLQFPKGSSVHVFKYGVLRRLF
jgi:hypothetical protein